MITITRDDLDGLKSTVESVRAQRYEGQIDHIVIDGGSGDDVVDYLSGCEPGFTHWQSEPDGGRYDAMNRGIARASGDLLWFMHSKDTFYDPYAVAQVVEAISAQGDARDVWGYGLQNTVGPDGSTIGCWAPVPFDIYKFVTRGMAVPHQPRSSGRRWWASSVATTQTSESRLTSCSSCKPRCCGIRSLFSVWCPTSTAREEDRYGPLPITFATYGGCVTSRATIPCEDAAGRSLTCACGKP